MDRFKFASYQRDWYIFEEKHRLRIDDDWIAIDAVNTNYKQLDCNSEKDPTTAPHVTIPIGGYFLRNLIIGRKCPIKIELFGRSAGSYNHNRGYDIAASGSYARSIENVSCEVAFSESALIISINGKASPVKQQRPPIPISGNQLEPLQFNYTFTIPLGDVPELLNMNQEQIFRYNRVINDMTST